MGARARQLLRIGRWAALILPGGCSLDLPMTTAVARSDLAREILSVYQVLVWVALGIATLVSVVLIYVLVRFRERPGAPLPRQTRGHTLLEIAWTVAPALVLLVIAIPTIQVIFTTQGAARPDALPVLVVGRQWWWEFQYPTLGVVTANELHLPAGRRIVLQLEGEDVIHSFWVPLLGGKRDVVPGRRNLLTLTADAPGEYWGQCAEFCGASHANMRLRVIVDPPEAFEAWLLAQRVPAAEPTGVAAEGKAIYARSACVGCHVIRGLSAGTLGPDLTHFGSRSTVAAGLYPNTVEHVTAWLKDPPALKPGVKMPRLGLTDEQARAVATYLLSLK